MPAGQKLGAAPLRQFVRLIVIHPSGSGGDGTGGGKRYATQWPKVEGACSATLVNALQAAAGPVLLLMNVCWQQMNCPVLLARELSG
jgi:hypothetical protein